MVRMFVTSVEGVSAGEGLARGLRKAFEIVELMKLVRLHFFSATFI